MIILEFKKNQLEGVSSLVKQVRVRTMRWQELMNAVAKELQ